MKASVELENFSERESNGLPDELLIKLQCIRYLVGKRVHITSGLRAGDSGTHGLGHAVDVADNTGGVPISSQWREAVLRAAYAVGFKRVGVYDRHIHLDIDLSRDQNVTWWGVSD